MKLKYTKEEALKRLASEHVAKRTDLGYRIIPVGWILDFMSDLYVYPRHQTFFFANSEHIRARNESLPCGERNLSLGKIEKADGTVMVFSDSVYDLKEPGKPLYFDGSWMHYVTVRASDEDTDDNIVILSGSGVRCYMKNCPFTPDDDLPGKSRIDFMQELKMLSEISIKSTDWIFYASVRYMMNTIYDCGRTS